MRISDWSSDLCSSDLQVGEHRKQHETAHERDGVVEAQRLQPRIARLGPGDAAMAIDARRSDIFGLAEQFLAAIGANDVAEDSPEIADIGILRNLDWWAHGRLCCTCEGAGSRAVLAHSYAQARLLSPMSCLPPPPGRPPARPACSSTSRSAPMRRRRSRARRRITCSPTCERKPGA